MPEHQPKYGIYLAPHDLRLTIRLFEGTGRNMPHTKATGDIAPTTIR
jgi:hypothetical protein